MAKISQAVDLNDFYLQVSEDKTIKILHAAAGPPPLIEGFLLGGGRMSRNAPHAGEIHHDGDEALLVLSGGIDVILEEPGGDRTVSISAGEAFVVPQSTWHRVELREPSDVVFLTAGPTNEHRPIST